MIAARQEYIPGLKDISPENIPINDISTGDTERRLSEILSLNLEYIRELGDTGLDESKIPDNLLSYVYNIAIDTKTLSPGENYTNEGFNKMSNISSDENLTVLDKYALDASDSIKLYELRRKRENEGLDTSAELKEFIDLEQICYEKALEIQQERELTEEETRDLKILEASLNRNRNTKTGIIEKNMKKLKDSLGL